MIAQSRRGRREYREIYSRRAAEDAEEEKQGNSYIPCDLCVLSAREFALRRAAEDAEYNMRDSIC